MKKRKDPSPAEMAVDYNVYSWSAKVEFSLNRAGGLKDFESCPLCLLWDQNYILTLDRVPLHPDLESAGSTGYRVRLDAAVTACEAELLGKRLACSLLLVAIERNWGLTLSWHDTPLPCRVIDRMTTTGDNVQVFASTSHRVTIGDFTSSLEEGFRSIKDVPDGLLLSMELCASSRLESSERARLVLLVSSIEALADQRDLSDEIGSLIQVLQNAVHEHTFQDSALKDSILGKIREFRRESIRQAMKRLVTSIGLGPEDAAFLNVVYDARSEIVHNGRRVPHLQEMNLRLGNLIQSIYPRLISPAKSRS